MASSRTNYLPLVGAAKDIYSAGPYRLFVTISFQYAMSLKQATAFGSTIWCRTQKKILGKRFRNQKKVRRSSSGLTGIAVIETAPIFAGRDFAKGTHHLHFALYDNSAYHRDDLAASMLVYFALSDVVARFRYLNCTLVTRGGIDVQPVYDQSGLARYLSKGSYSPGWEWSDRVKYVHSHGLT